MMGIRVLSVDGEPINGMQAVMRNILRTVDAMPLLPLMIFGGPPVYVIPLFCVGLGAMTLNRRFQRLGDLVCGTMVVIEERGWLTGVAKIDDLRAVQLAAYLPTDLQVSRPLAKALATYVERRRYFSQARRREVARHLGQPLLVRFGLPADTSHDLLLCAMYYRTFIADRGKDEQYATGQSPYAAGQSPYAGLTAVDPAVPSPLIARTP